MSENYKFYVRMDNQTFGPYTAKEVQELELMDDILVTEESMNGQWLPARKFDFDDMVRKEGGMPSAAYGPASQQSYGPASQQNTYSPTSTAQYQNVNVNVNVNPDGSVTNPNGWRTPTQYNSNEVPAEINKWNWGAFFFNWIWGVFNGVYWPLIIIPINFIPGVGPFISLGLCIVLGVKGSEWAWKAKRWDNVEHFKKVQHNWAMAILWVLGISFVLGLLIGLAGG